MLWSKDGGELPDIERMIVEGRELTITTLNKTDNGTYRCEASNHLGTSSAEYVLFVYGEYSDDCAFAAHKKSCLCSLFKALRHTVTPRVLASITDTQSEQKVCHSES